MYRCDVSGFRWPAGRREVLARPPFTVCRPPVSWFRLVVAAVRTGLGMCQTALAESSLAAYLRENPHVGAVAVLCSLPLLPIVLVSCRP